MSDGLVVAAAQYPIDALPGLDGWRDKVAAWVGEAASAGADLLLFPEYAALELVSTLDPAVRADLRAQLHAVAGLADTCLAHWRALAARHGIYILAGTLPAVVDGQLRNRAWLVAPDGPMGFQDKLRRTRTEHAEWAIAGGDEVHLFDTALGRIGILVCYDVEFPEPARALIEAGADLLLVPSCTETEAGCHRVRIGCQARALENQAPVAQAVTVGDAPWSLAVDVNRGAAAVYGPPDLGFPDDGVLAIGRRDQPAWVMAALDFRRFRDLRDTGAVANHTDFRAAEHLPMAKPMVVAL